MFWFKACPKCQGDLHRDTDVYCSYIACLQCGSDLTEGGPSSGLFLQLTTEHAQDKAIPDAPYTFGVLADAQALGDLQALRAAKRRAVRVHLGYDPEEGIRRMADELA